MTPDGLPVKDKSSVTERWGNCSNRYYCLDIEYYMSGLTRRVVGILAKNFLWMSVLSSSLKNEREYRERFSDRVNKIANKLESAGKKSIDSNLLIQDVKATMLVRSMVVAALELAQEVAELRPCPTIAVVLMQILVVPLRYRSRLLQENKIHKTQS